MPRLDRLDEAASSPSKHRQFDVLLSVTAPHELLLFIITLLLIMSGMAWMLFWNVERTIHIDGLLINPGARHEVTTLDSGHLIEYTRRKGDIVMPGDRIARQSIPELDRELVMLWNRLLHDMKHVTQEDSTIPAEQKNQAAIRSLLSSIEAQRAARENIVTHVGGEVVALHADPGEFLPAGSTVSRIRKIPEDRPDEMQVVLRVEPNIAKRIRLGMPSKIHVDFPGRGLLQFTGEVVAVDYETLPNWLATLPPIVEGAKYRIDIELHQTTDNPLPDATVCQVTVILGETTPLQMLATNLTTSS
ncbi:MAG: hypothetical protein OXF73_07775 [Gammaproteobacteria bacterium]|nr:hypothetical protein [Gammaproteobacteria bacterium]MCY4227760.1 hypothetical protein [Gammaproteobacteria bacterium]